MRKGYGSRSVCVCVSLCPSVTALAATYLVYKVQERCYKVLYGISNVYCIAGKFGGELNLAVWRSAWATAKLNSAKISYSHVYLWRSRTEPPNLNSPIRLKWQFGTQPPNLIPANITGYTVYCVDSTENTLFTSFGVICLQPLGSHAFWWVLKGQLGWTMGTVMASFQED